MYLHEFAKDSMSFLALKICTGSLPNNTMKFLMQSQPSLKSEEYRQLFRLPPEEVSILEVITTFCYVLLCNPSRFWATCIIDIVNIEAIRLLFVLLIF